MSSGGLNLVCIDLLIHDLVIFGDEHDIFERVEVYIRSVIRKSICELVCELIRRILLQTGGTMVYRYGISQKWGL